MGKITVPDVDRDLGKAVVRWEGIDCIFMAKIAGGVQFVSKVYLYKDRLYEDFRIPKEVFRRLSKQAAAILADRREKHLAELSKDLKAAQSAEQLALF